MKIKNTKDIFNTYFVTFSLYSFLEKYATHSSYNFNINYNIIAFIKISK